MHGRFGAAREAQIVQSDLVDREETTGGAVFRCHVGDGCAVGQGQLGQAVPVELDELAHHAFLAQHLCHGQHQVSGSDALPQLAGQLEADHFGISIDTGWPSMAASASMPPTPQPSTPRPLIMVVCESVPTKVSGKA